LGGRKEKRFNTQGKARNTDRKRQESSKLTKQLAFIRDNETKSKGGGEKKIELATRNFSKGSTAASGPCLKKEREKRPRKREDRRTALYACSSEEPLQRWGVKKKKANASNPASRRKKGTT